MISNGNCGLWVKLNRESDASLARRCGHALDGVDGDFSDRAKVPRLLISAQWSQGLTNDMADQGQFFIVSRQR